MYKAKVRHSDIPFSGLVGWLVSDLFIFIKDLGELTTRGESHNATRTDNVPFPIPLCVQFEQVIFLGVIEVQTLVVVARQAFMRRDCDGAKMNAVVL